MKQCGHVVSDITKYQSTRNACNNVDAPMRPCKTIFSRSSALVLSIMEVGGLTAEETETKNINVSHNSLGGRREVKKFIKSVELGLGEGITLVSDTISHPVLQGAMCGCVTI